MSSKSSQSGENSSFVALLEKFQNNWQSFGLFSERAGFEPGQVNFFFYLFGIAWLEEKKVEISHKHMTARLVIPKRRKMMVSCWGFLWQISARHGGKNLLTLCYRSRRSRGSTRRRWSTSPGATATVEPGSAPSAPTEGRRRRLEPELRALGPRRSYWNRNTRYVW